MPLTTVKPNAAGTAVSSALRGVTLYCDASELVPRPSYESGDTRLRVFGARAIICTALLAGTGGMVTLELAAERYKQGGYRLPYFDYAHRETVPPANDIRSPAEKLTFVRSAFAPSISEMARLFGVSRQTIYNWQAGEPIAQQNEDRLDQLAHAADVLRANGISEQASVMRRKLADGKTFFDLVREGKPATEVAVMLVSLIQKEAAQRQVLADRLAGRAKKRVDVEDVGAPHLSERA